MASQVAAEQENATITVPPFKVHISNLPLDCMEHHIPNFFMEDRDDIKNIEIKRSNGNSKGWGFVTFGTLESMKHALTLSGKGFGGNIIKVKVAIDVKPIAPLERYTPIISKSVTKIAEET